MRGDSLFKLSPTFKDNFSQARFESIAGADFQKF